MNGNLSSAVRQQRTEPHTSLDDFPTPPWAARRLLSELMSADDWAAASAWEPAANRGAIVRALTGLAGTVHASDVHDYGTGFAVHDFLMPGDPLHTPDWIITNPPFRLALDFALRGLEVARRGVALIVRTAFLEGGTRHRELFELHPPTLIAQHCERVIMHRGVLRDPDIAYWDPMKNDGEGGMRKPSTATAYCWLVWDREAPEFAAGDTLFKWIPPCRREWERPGDYEPFDGEAAA